MSIDATRWAWQQSNLRPSHKLVLLSLADRAGADHRCYPSKAMLRDDTGLDQKTIWEALSELVSRGLIEDSGSRVGTTKQIVVWQLLGVESRHEKHSRNGSVPETEAFRFSSESIPKTDKKAFRKRNTEPIREPIRNQSRGDAAEKPSGTRIPDDWKLPDEWRDWAMSKRGWDLRTVYEVAECFRDHWKASAAKTAVKLDWVAAWRNWVRNERRRDSHANNQPRDTSAVGKTRSACERWEAQFETAGSATRGSVLEGEFDVQTLQ